MRPSGSSTAGRRMALRVLTEVEARGAYADVALARAAPALDPGDDLRRARERAFAEELAYGVLRRLLTIDHVLAHYLRSPLSELPVPVRNILRLGAYELLFAETEAYAAVSQEVSLARRYGHTGTVALVNAVLRGISRERDAILRGERVPFPSLAEDPVQAISLRHSCPPWLVQRWLDRLGVEEAEALAGSLSQVPPLLARCNLARVQPETLLARLQEEGVEVRPARYLPECFQIASCPSPAVRLPSFQEGWFSFQDEGSALVVHVLSPQPGDMVIDACSAPGTKTAQILERMGGKGQVLAVDVHPYRLRLVEEGCRRLGLQGLQTLLGDARHLAAAVEARWGHLVEKVLVDVPCSGIGALARRPDLRWHRQESDLAALAALQREILQGAAEVVGPGGTLVYSTCTTEPEENQQVVDWFLATHPDFEPENLAPYLPAGLRGEEQDHSLQLWPHRHGTDGFFISRLRRTER